MGKRETTRRTRWAAAARIAIALAALTPTVATAADHAPQHLAPAPAASVAVLASSEPPREAAEWERLRRHHHHL
jgi:hypothetical protein